MIGSVCVIFALLNLIRQIGFTLVDNFRTRQAPSELLWVIERVNKAVDCVAVS